MAYTEASKKATLKYIKSHLEEIKIRVPKGKKSEYMEAARERGYKSFTAFAVQAIEEKINKT